MPNEPLTYEEHHELGQEIRKARQRMARLSSMLSEVYGANNRCSFAFEKLNEAMDQLLDELGRQATADCPGTGADALYR